MHHFHVMKLFRLNLNLTSIIVVIAVGVLLPVLLSTATGIVALCTAENTGGIVTGVLIISFTVTAAGCGLLAIIFAGKKARLARQQSDFIANISHELRTPLSAIKLYAQTLQSDKIVGDPVKVEQCVATILRETAWLDSMIERVLTWRGSSKDMMDLHMKTETVAASVNSAIERFQSMVRSDEVELNVSIETNLRVKHDTNSLNVVIVNLLTNAYKYTGSDKKIGVTVCDAANSVIVKVTDNGIGLTLLEIKRMFQPFYRSDRKGAVEMGGAGLGLAISRYIILKHKGTISAGGADPQGTTVTIILPVAEVSS